VILSLVHGRNIDGAATGGISILACEVEPPLVLRSKRKGDRILLETGVTLVNDLLAGWKIPQAEKNGIPILADRRGVLAVLGGALGFRTRARAGAIAENREDADRMAVLLSRPQAAIRLAEQRDQGKGT
jgi:tRNA(Ile)-lysidine synthetase-like protein